MKARTFIVLMCTLMISGYSQLVSAMELVHLNSAKPPPSPLKQSQLEAQGIEPEPGIPIWGHLSKPEGEGPFPALVLMHGCGGIHSSHDLWAKLLNKLGYVTLILDSFRPRNIFSVCSTFSRQASPPVRALDAQGALHYLQELNYVNAQNIGVIGWSHGGMSALASVSKYGMVSKFGQRFKMAIAFYPYCFEDQTSEIPVLVLIGESDDWTPLSACRKLEERSRISQLPFEMIVYPDAHHAFDDPALDEGFSVTGINGQKHLIHYNEAAHADSIDRVKSYLKKHLSP